MRQLDIKQLSTFKAIAECGSLSLAAKRVHLTQAAVSMQLKKLEQITATKLIDRNKYRATLTNDGDRLLQYAQRILKLNDEAIDFFSAAQQVEGCIRFGIPDDYAAAYLLLTIKAFSQTYPQVKLHIINDISQNLFSALNDGSLDLALVTLDQYDERSEILRKEELHWVAETSVVVDCSQPLPLALYPHGCGFRNNILHALSKHAVPYELAFECSGVTGVRIAVDSGLAITATCQSFIQPNWQILDRHELGLPQPKAVVLELRSGAGPVSAVQEAFMDKLKEVVLQL